MKSNNQTQSAKKACIGLLVLGLILNPASPCRAQTAASLIRYQGSLSHSGALVNGSTPMVLRLTSSDGSIEYWTSGSTRVAVTNGLFRYPLGTPNAGAFEAINWEQAAPYIELTVNGTLLLPREPLTSVPYSLSAKSLAPGAMIQAPTLDMAGKPVTNLGSPSLGTDAANKAYVDSATMASGGVWRLSGTGAYNLNSGNVGVGTTSPAEKLSVAGTIQSTSGGFKFPDGSLQTTAAGAASWTGLPSKPPWMATANLTGDISNANSSVPSGFYQAHNGPNFPTGGWYNLLNVRHSNTANDHGFQITNQYGNEDFYTRGYFGGTGNNDGTFTPWRRLAREAGSYTFADLTLTGGLTSSGHVVQTGGDPYFRTDADDKHIVLSGGSGWSSTGATMVLRGASAGWNAGGFELNGADGAARNAIFNNLNVGIGMAHPNHRLAIAGAEIGSAAGFDKFATTNIELFTPHAPGAGDGVITLHHGGKVAHQLRYDEGNLFLEASARPGYGTTSTPNLLVGGNVGVGTTSPAEKLSVAGTIQSTSGGFKFPDGSLQTTAAASWTEGLTTNGHVVQAGSDPYFRTNADDKHIVLSGGSGWSSTGATMVLRGASAGWNAGGFELNGADGAARNAIFNNLNVGIGTASPAEKLDVHGNLALMGKPVLLTGGANMDVYANIRVLRSMSTYKDGLHFGYGGTGGPIRFYTNGSTSDIGLMLGSDGNVGIGTASPGSTLDVAGTIRATAVTIKTNLVLPVLTASDPQPTAAGSIWFAQ